MKVLVLHSDVAPDAPPDELDTLIAADAVAAALKANRHQVELAPFTTDPERFRKLMDGAHADVVFNLVEGVDGLGQHAPVAPKMLFEYGAVFTGAEEAAMAMTNDKPSTKRKLLDAGVPTPGWAEPPEWSGLQDATYIVKSSLEDASHGLDDGCVVKGIEKIKTRASDCYKKFGGKWFAEEFVDGREFNIAVLQGPNGPLVLPMAEMVFEAWPADRPRIVGYTAKWDDASFESVQTVRHFGVETREPELAAALKRMCERCWEIFDLTGYARVDFRVAADGRPLVLEINTNPGIAPDAGFAAAAAQFGLSYGQLIERILEAAWYRR